MNTVEAAARAEEKEEKEEAAAAAQPQEGRQQVQRHGRRSDRRCVSSVHRV